MKTVRFSKVTEASGQPETYLVLMDPEHDKTLKAAVKAGRVMTVHQETVGHKADRGEIGFEPGPKRQFLIFPRSLRRFAGSAVVGINYDLFETRPARKAKPLPKKAAPPKAKAKSKTPGKEKPATKPAPPRKVIAFQPAERSDASDEDADEAIAELKKKVRHAMDVLEDGKPVAAFNLLKRIVES